MSQRRGTGGGDPSFLCIRPWNLIISTKITCPLKPLVTVPPISTNWLWILFDKLYHWERLISYFIYSSIQTYIYVNFPIHAHRKRNSFCANYKGAFKNFIILFGGVLDPPLPPHNPESSFGLPLPPSLKDDVIFFSEFLYVRVRNKY